VSAHAPIYLDHNATTPLLPEVVDAMLPYLREHFGNPSSAHAFGIRAHVALENARAQVGSLIGAQADEIVFTSGGTESNNLAIRGAAEARPAPAHVVTTTIEHPATQRPCAWLAARGWRVSRIGVDETGRARLDQGHRAFQNAIALLTVMHANNETGVIQPVAELAAWARGAGALVHCDAAQSVGKLAVHVDALGVDLLSIAGHKLYAPKGIGALYVRRGTPISAVLLGAGQERGLRPGTENIASIVGLGTACEIAARTLNDESKRISALRDALFQKLQAGIPGLVLNGHARERLPNTLNVRFPSARSEALLAACPEVAASTGSACHAGSTTPSEVLVAMGLREEEALASLRLSLGRGTTAEAVNEAASVLVAAWKRVAQRDVRASR
jgi:cysteine desulfurase